MIYAVNPILQSWKLGTEAVPYLKLCGQHTILSECDTAGIKETISLAATIQHGFLIIKRIKVSTPVEPGDVLICLKSGSLLLTTESGQ